MKKIFLFSFLLVGTLVFFASFSATPVDAALATSSGKCNMTCDNGSSCNASGASPCECYCSFWTGNAVCSCAGTTAISSSEMVVNHQFEAFLYEGDVKGLVEEVNAKVLEVGLVPVLNDALLDSQTAFLNGDECYPDTLYWLETVTRMFSKSDQQQIEGIVGVRIYGLPTV